MSDVTAILQSLTRGEAEAGNLLMEAVYHQLRRLAGSKMVREPAGHVLEATALVHEAWLRLGDRTFQNRLHFFSAAAEAMRRILVECARHNHCLKRGGGGAEYVDLEKIQIAAPSLNGELLAVHDVLDELALVDPRKAELVKLRYFAGLSFGEAAEILNISLVTAKRDWAFARAWLHDAITAP